MTDKQFKEDLVTLDIPFDDAEYPSIRSVNLKFKKLAKVKHPDKPGGTNEDFQKLIAAYRRVIEYLEKAPTDTVDKEDDDHFEKEFFMRSNFPKEN